MWLGNSPFTPVSALKFHECKNNSIPAIGKEDKYIVSKKWHLRKILMLSY